MFFWTAADLNISIAVKLYHRDDIGSTHISYMFSVARIHHCRTYQGLTAKAKYKFSFARVVGLNPRLQTTQLRKLFCLYVLSESVFQSTNCYLLLVS